MTLEVKAAILVTVYLHYAVAPPFALTATFTLSGHSNPYNQRFIVSFG